MSRHAGIPLLSGPPPPRSGPPHTGCRKCGKEFGVLFNRRRECMHCGYEYCPSCTDYQALLPRRGPAHGYDLASVCAYCIEMLNTTALGRAQLRSLPLAKLRRYIDAYNIPVKNPVDKNDLVDAAVAARTPQGCLPSANEDYYRKHSVPSSSTPGSSPPSSAHRNAHTRGFSGTNLSGNARSNRSFPRPDLDPNRQPRPQEAPYATYTPRTTSSTRRSRSTAAPMNPETTRPTGGQPDIHHPPSSTGRQSPPHTTSTPHTSSPPRAAPPLPPPPMSTLVTLPRSSFSAFSVGTLKLILWEARVRVPPGIVEKEELVDRVWALVEEEKRKDNEGLEDVGLDMDEDGMVDTEEEAAAETVYPDPEAHPGVAHEHGHANRHYATDGGHVRGAATDFAQPSSRSPSPKMSTSPPNRSTSPPHPASKPRPRSHPRPTSAERPGLCVVCQDEEACIAVVDCGHLAMCRECSDLVLASSRECPLCRTRIVTEGRLLRIFKT